MTFFIILLCIAVIPAAIAKSKGRSFFLWYLYGVALWIVAMIHSVVLKEDTAQETRESITGKTEKRCPYCSEFVNINAIVCKHCGRDLVEKKQNASSNNNTIIEQKTKVTPSVEVENDFDPNKQEEWVSHRIVNLISEGKPAGDAKIQAEAEFMVKKTAFEKAKKDKEEHDKEMKEFKDKNVFIYEDHVEKFNTIECTLDLVKYLEELPITNEYFINEVLPEIRKIGEIERLYGRNLDSALKKLKELTTVETEEKKDESSKTQN